jgi:hypothetical protein
MRTGNNENTGRDGRGQAPTGCRIYTPRGSILLLFAILRYN